MEAANKKFDYKTNGAIFQSTFAELAKAFPEGLSRTDSRKTTPLNLYEGVAVGAALALQKREHLVTTGVNEWMAHPKLREYTTGGTNSPRAVRGRIEFCRDRFLGEPYVDSSKN